MTILYRDPLTPTLGRDYIFPFSWVQLYTHWYGSLYQRLLFEILTWTGFGCIVIATKIYVGDWPDFFTQMLAVLSNVLSPILTFMLGFYTSILYSRWWNCRASIGGSAQGAIYNMALYLHQFVYDDSDPITAARLKQRVVRWCNLAFGIMVRDVFEGDHFYSSLESMERIGMVTSAERSRIENEVTRFSATAPIMWAGHTLTRLRDDGYRFGVTHFVHQVLSQQLAQLRGGIGGCYMYVNVPMPLPYRQLVNGTVRAYMLAISLLSGNLALINKSSTLGNGNARWIDVLYVLAVFTIYIGWLHVADELANPFRMAPDGLDWDDYLSDMRADTGAMVDDNCVRLPTVASIVEEPLPGDPGWNLPVLRRDHEYEAIPGWRKYRREGSTPHLLRRIPSVYSAYAKERSSEIERQRRSDTYERQAAAAVRPSAIPEGEEHLDGSGGGARNQSETCAEWSQRMSQQRWRAPLGETPSHAHDCVNAGAASNGTEGARAGVDADTERWPPSFYFASGTADVDDADGVRLDGAANSEGRLPSFHSAPPTPPSAAQRETHVAIDRGGDGDVRDARE